MAGMQAYFRPGLSESQPCWHCVSFDGMLYAGSAAACERADGSRVRSMPANGCSAFVREVGTDDEPGPPATVMAWTPQLARSSPRP